MCLRAEYGMLLIMDTSLPLAGHRIVVTAHRKSLEMATSLVRRGAEVLTAPVLSTLAHADDADLAARTAEVVDRPVDLVVVTTGVGFAGWMAAADEAGRGEALRAALGSARFVARGPKGRGQIQAAGFTCEFVAQSETHEEVRDHLIASGVAGLRVAVQHHGAGSDGLDEALRQAGAEVVPVVVYRWGPSPAPEAVEQALHEVAAREVDAVIFTAAPGAKAFLAAAERLGLLEAVVAAFAPSGPVIAATVGPVTAAPLAELGIDALVPQRYRTGAMLRELTDLLTARS